MSKFNTEYNEDISCIFTDDNACLLYTSDAADDMQCVDLGGRRIIKKTWEQLCRTASSTEKPSLEDKYAFFQAEDGIRDVERSRGLGDVYKRQASASSRP